MNSQTYKGIDLIAEIKARILEKTQIKLLKLPLIANQIMNDAKEDLNKDGLKMYKGT
jgi:hypothetical protein